jgi:hypothetical protein
VAEAAAGIEHARAARQRHGAGQASAPPPGVGKQRRVAPGRARVAGGISASGQQPAQAGRPAAAPLAASDSGKPSATSARRMGVVATQAQPTPSALPSASASGAESGRSAAKAAQAASQPSSAGSGQRAMGGSAAHRRARDGAAAAGAGSGGNAARDAAATRGAGRMAGSRRAWTTARCGSSRRGRRPRSVQVQRAGGLALAGPRGRVAQPADEVLADLVRMA